MERDLETTLSLLNKEIGEKQKVIDQLEVVENEKAHVMQQLEESGRQSGLKEQQLKKELRDTVRDLETDKVKLKMHYAMQLEKERRKKDNDFQSKVQLITAQFEKDISGYKQTLTETEKTLLETQQTQLIQDCSVFVPALL